MDDTIRRQAAIGSAISGMTMTIGGEKWIRVSEVRESLYSVSSAQRKGKWIATKEWGGRNYSCSCCHFSFMVDTCMREPMWNYCPNCGAEMKGEGDE